MSAPSSITKIVGQLPYRMAFAGGWIDQPFISQHHPSPPGSMVVVAVEPTFRFMDLSGMGTSTRKVATKLWNAALPDGDPMERVRELYKVENQGRPEPSGSQDMIGLIYPGISRLDYDFSYEGGIFPVHIESNNDPDIAHWLEEIIHVLPIAQRPPGYNPLGEKNLDPEWIRRLGQSGKDCYNAIITKNLAALGASMNECMLCWQAILPHTVSHPTLTLNLKEILNHYQSHYAGAMYSGCGGGYIYVVSEGPVPGAFHVKVRVSENSPCQKSL